MTTKSAKFSSSLLRKWISEFDDGIYTTEGKVIYCQPCSQNVHCTKHSHLTQHNESKKHEENVNRAKTKSQQQFLAASFSNAEKTNKEHDQFTEDLCDMLIGANIPFKKHLK